MLKTFAVLLVSAIALFAPSATATEAPLPLVPNTAIATDTPAVLFPTARNARSREDAAPVRVSIPSIALDSPIQNVGLTKNNEMDVPDGSTNSVGWYRAGTTPGEQGSAVFDAHVFAAFAQLDKLKAGDDIYVTAKDGAVLRFRVEEAVLYKLGALPPELLFNRADKKRLNLITCAGSLTADRSTYTHRLVVYAVLVEDAA